MKNNHILYNNIYILNNNNRGAAIITRNSGTRLDNITPFNELIYIYTSY